MKTLFDIIHSLRAIIWFFLLFFAITLGITYASVAQTTSHRCPINDKVLKKATIDEEHYDFELSILTKTYFTEYGSVQVRIHNVDSSSYYLHLREKTIPTNADDLVYVRFRNKTKIYTLSEVLSATGQVK